MPEPIPKLLINFGGKQRGRKAYIENPSPFTLSISSQSTVLACVKQQVLNQEGRNSLNFF